jgi:CubicO group peptidase (beta-lactamase class C family)
MSSSLSDVSSWPVQHAAAAVVSPAGVIERIGPTDMAFGLASVTKPLAALAILVAVEEEAVGLDDAIDPERFPGVTLAHLLSHAGGIRPDSPVRIAAPASRRVYSNAGYDLAGHHLVASTGIPFADYFIDALTPLALRSTTLIGSPARDGISTVDDLSLVLSELLAPGRLLDRATLAAATTVAFPGLRGVVPGFGMQDPCDWGTGFEIRGHKSPHWMGSLNSPATYGHFGQAGTMLWVDPVAQLGLVALSDRPFSDWAAAAWPALSDSVLAAYR